MKLVVAVRAKAKGLFSEERKPRATNRRLNRIQSSMEALQARVRRDLRSSDPDRFLTALAVGLITETNEDPVTSWQKKNVQIEDRTAVFRTKGKRKAITNGAIVRALADAYEAVEDGDEELFAHDTGRVTAEMVNDYLGASKLSLKDIRGYNANCVMQSKLAEIRASGPELPRHKRSRLKVLRGEFFKALEGTAEEIGLEADMIRFNYLPQGLEASYLSDGSLNRTACSVEAAHVAYRFLNRGG